ncbi:MAG: divalent-cation tolerance protein CutA [Candidatus Omnitrophota bacterium]
MPPKKKTNYIIIFVTASSLKEAKKIAQILLAGKEAACVNIIKNIDSYFNWKDKLEKAKEFLLIIKTKQNLFEKVKSTVKKYHSYSVPEIIAIPVIKGDKSYLNWVREVTL